MDPDPYIVGVSNDPRVCGDGWLAFRMQWGNPGAYDALLPHATTGPCPDGPNCEFQSWSVALDVAESTGEPNVYGYSVSCEFDTSDCESDTFPIVWNADGVPDGLHNTDGGGAQARGVNHALNIVGLDLIDAGGPQDCDQPAAFWDTANSSPELLPLQVAANHHRAEAVSNPDEHDELVIVGGNVDAIRALAWTGDLLGGWTLIDLTTALSDCCDEADDWVRLEWAFDVNDDGLIVGYGLKNPNDPRRHYFLLTPQPNCTCCPGDADVDGDVDVDDLLAVLDAWGPCPGCAEDFDCDNAVDVDDLLLVLAEWGTTCEESARGLAMPLETALAVTGFEDLDAFASWAKTASPGELTLWAEVLTVLVAPDDVED